MTTNLHADSSVSAFFEEVTEQSPLVSGPVDPTRLTGAKKAYTTRFLAAELQSSAEGYSLRAGQEVVPAAGDVVLARVEQIGMHTRLESPESRRQTLFVGDEILVAYGNRYAPDQFLADVPVDLQECHLVAGGGVAGRVSVQHAKVLDATVIRPLGLLADATGTVTLSRLAPYRTSSRNNKLPLRPPVIGVMGTSMNSGKTTVAACITKGLSIAGLRVATGKVTGTGSGNDPGLFVDAGASAVLDFTDFGYSTTFRQSQSQIRDLLLSLIVQFAEAGPDVIILEIADGLYQEETRRLLDDPVFHEAVDHVVFCASDALGADAGTRLLREAGVHVAAVSGRMSASPLAMGEAMGVLAVPVHGSYDLCEPSISLTLMPGG